MNNFFNNKNKEFLITAIVGVVVVFCLCLAFELGLMFHIENKVNKEELNMANLARFCTIEELERYLAKDKNNYFISIKLAKIYDSLGEYKIAHEYYQRALKQSGRSNFALYSYALFCANRSLYAISSTMAEELVGNTKLNMRYKAEIYEAIGDNLDLDGHPRVAVNAYQVAYKYYKTLNRKIDFSRIKTKYSLEYIEVAYA